MAKQAKCQATLLCQVQVSVLGFQTKMKLLKTKRISFQLSPETVNLVHSIRKKLRVSRNAVVDKSMQELVRKNRIEDVIEMITILENKMSPTPSWSLRAENKLMKSPSAKELSVKMAELILLESVSRRLYLNDTLIMLSKKDLFHVLSYLTLEELKNVKCSVIENLKG